MVVKRANGSAPQVPDEVQQARLVDAQDARDERAVLAAQSTDAQSTDAQSSAGQPTAAQSTDALPTTGQPTNAQSATGQPTDAHSQADEAALARAAHERDPRAIARASLDAGRNVSLWWTSAGVIVSLVVSLVVGTRAGAYTLAGVLAACAVARILLPSPGPLAISVRARWIDVSILGVLAATIAVLAQLLPGNTL